MTRQVAGMSVRVGISSVGSTRHARYAQFARRSSAPHWLAAGRSKEVLVPRDPPNRLDSNEVINVMVIDDRNDPPFNEADGDTGKERKVNPPNRGSSPAGPRPFPRRTVEQALRVPQALKENNGGNEWPSKEVAKALGVGAGTANFYYLTAASRDYGLTIGTRDSATIRLTDLGRQAVYPGSDEEERQAQVGGFLKVESFRKVLEHYRGNALPEYRFLENTLQQGFGLDPVFHEEFLEIFDKNCRFLGIGADYFPGKLPEQLRQVAVRPVGKGAATVARPSDSAKEAHVCFVIMPFTERDDRHQSGFFDEVLINLFTPALTDAGFQVRTAKRHGSDVIQSTIVNELLEADLVLADLKEYNPSLWRTALEKDIPRLTEHIRGAWENRETIPTFMKILRRPK